MIRRACGSWCTRRRSCITSWCTPCLGAPWWACVAHSGGDEGSRAPWWACVALEGGVPNAETGGGLRRAERRVSGAQRSAAERRGSAARGAREGGLSDARNKRKRQCGLKPVSFLHHVTAKRFNRVCANVTVASRSYRRLPGWLGCVLCVPSRIGRAPCSGSSEHRPDHTRRRSVHIQLTACSMLLAHVIY